MRRLSAPVVLVLVVSTACNKAPAPSGSTAPPSAASPATGAPPQQPSSAPPAAPAAAAAAQDVKPVPAQLPSVVARVNGESIERWELESVLKQAEASAGSAVPPDQRDGVLRNLLDELVNYHMLAQEARTRKVSVTEADLDARIKMIKDSFPSDAAFDQAVKERGLTADRLRQQERRGLQAKKLLDAEVNSKVNIGDADVEKFYKENIDRFKQGETFHSSHIFVSAPSDAAPEAKRAARAKADEILKQLKAGADFAKLAREQSDDTTAENGGDMGFNQKGDLPPDYEQVVFSLKPGEMSGVVELGAGYHIIKYHEKRAPRTVPIEEVRGQLKDFLTERELQAKLQQFMDAVKGKSKIELLV